MLSGQLVDRSLQINPGLLPEVICVPFTPEDLAVILEHPVCQRPGQLGNRYSGLGGGPPYAKFLDELKAAGYEGTELGPYGYLPADATELKDQLEQEIPVNQLHLRRDEFHGEWNYEILPRKTAQHGNAIY